VGGGAIGSVSGGGTLQLTSGGYAVPMSGLGIANLAISAGANLFGSGSVAAAVVNAGSIALTTGTLAFLGKMTNAGTITAASGLLSIASDVAGTGTLAITSGGTLSLLAGAGSGQQVVFSAGTDLLDLTKPAAFAGVIAGLGATDQIDLINTIAGTFTYAGNMLTVSSGNTAVATLRLNGTYNSGSFSLVSDGQGGTFIKYA
jgi:hypothetical protein